jgi:hypothetical protein
MLYFVFGYFETVYLNFKTSRTTENNRAKPFAGFSEKGIWQDGS